MRWLAVGLFSSGGCVYLDGEAENYGHRQPWSGTVERDGAVLVWSGFSTAGQTEYLSHTADAIGYLSTDVGGVLGELSVDWTDLDAAAAAEQRTLSVGTMDGAAEPEVLLTWTESDLSWSRLFQHDPMNPECSASGTLTITDTDWATFLEGELQAEVTDPNGAVRRLDVQLTWGGQD